MINGFPDLTLALVGPKVGESSRSAVGLAELHFGIPVVIEGDGEGERAV